MPLTSSNKSGFTLIELAVVILVVGLFIGVIAQALKLYVVQRQDDQLASVVENAEKSFADYVNTQGRYPCPAPRTGSDMGVPGDCTDISIAFGECVDGVCIAQGIDGRRVRIGGIPYGDENLNLTLADTIDPFGNQLTYAVTEHLATPSYAENEGDITVEITDVQGNTITKTGNEFTFLSHGRDGAGSYTASGVSNGEVCEAVESAGVDRENCDNDAIFATSLQTSTVNGSAHFDDALTHDLQFSAVNVSCPEGELLMEIASNEPVCEPIADVIAPYLDDILNAHLSQLACPSGQVMAGFDSNAQLVCVADQQGGGGGGGGSGVGGGGCQRFGWANTGIKCGDIVVTHPDTPQ